MSKLAVLTLGAALSIAYAQTATTPTTGPNTTGTPDMGATTPQSNTGSRVHRSAPPDKSQPEVTTPTTVPNTTGTDYMGAATPQTHPHARSAATRSNTTGHIPETAATHTGSTPIAANQSGVRTMPHTSAGWLQMLLLGSLLTAAGILSVFTRVHPWLKFKALSSTAARR